MRFFALVRFSLLSYFIQQGGKKLTKKRPVCAEHFQTQFRFLCFILAVTDTGNHQHTARFRTTVNKLYSIKLAKCFNSIVQRLKD